MKLIAAMNTRNELDRYLRTTIPALLEWVDEVRVFDDGSEDGTPEYLEAIDERVVVRRRVGNLWASHEGELHQELLDFTIKGSPTHILTIDADEIVPQGAAVRAALEEHPDQVAFTLRMVEVWGLEPVTVRCDGGWRPHPVGILYRVPGWFGGEDWLIAGRQLASPRVPRAIVAEVRRRKALELEHDILHLGWARPEERAARYRRYEELDGGRFHAKHHLDSILWPDGKCDLRPYDGPALPALP